KSAVAASLLLSTDQSSSAPSSAKVSMYRAVLRTAAAESNARAPSTGGRSVILEITPNHACGIQRCRFRGEVPGRLLGFDLNLRIRGNQLRRYRHALHDSDSGCYQGLMLQIRHRDQPVDAGHAEPMQHVGHELLKTGILHPGHTFGAREIRRGLVPAWLALARVVDQELGHLPQCPPLLAVIDDEAGAAGLRLSDTLLDAVGEVWPTSADVGPEHIRAVALIMDPARQWTRRIVDGCGVTKNIQRHAPDGRQENVQVAAGHQL